MTALINREAMLKLRGKLRTKDVPMPELGEDLAQRVRAPSAAEQMAFFRTHFMKRDADGNIDKKHVSNNVREALLIASCVDESGALTFVEGDTEVLTDLPADIVVRVYDAAAELWGIQTQDDSGKDSRPTAAA